MSRYRMKDLAARGHAWTKDARPKARRLRCRVCDYETDLWAELEEHWQRTHGRRRWRDADTP